MPADLSPSLPEVQHRINVVPGLQLQANTHVKGGKVNAVLTRRLLTVEADTPNIPIRDHRQPVYFCANQTRNKPSGGTSSQ